MRNTCTKLEQFLGKNILHMGGEWLYEMSYSRAVFVRTQCLNIFFAILLQKCCTDLDRPVNWSRQNLGRYLL